MTPLGLAIVIGVIVVIAVLVDPWVAPESPTDRERREWLQARARMMSGRDV
jgi:hypothetical protein